MSDMQNKLRGYNKTAGRQAPGGGVCSSVWTKKCAQKLYLTVNWPWVPGSARMEPLP